MKYNNWYAIQTAALCEAKVRRDILARRTQLGDTHITDVEVPESTEMEITAVGKQKIKKVKIVPGYVFIRVTPETSQEDGQEPTIGFPTLSHDIIMSTPNVLGFAGPNRKKPYSMGSDEIQRLFKLVDNSHLEVKTNVLSNYSVGDTVDIVSGPFAGSSVIIDAIQSDKIITTIDICGRLSRLELNVEQVYKKS